MQKFDVSEIQSPFLYMKDTPDDQLLVDTMNMQSMNMKILEIQIYSLSL